MDGRAVGNAPRIEREAELERPRRSAVQPRGAGVNARGSRGDDAGADGEHGCDVDLAAFGIRRSAPRDRTGDDEREPTFPGDEARDEIFFFFDKFGSLFDERKF